MYMLGLSFLHSMMPFLCTVKKNYSDIVISLIWCKESGPFFGGGEVKLSGSQAILVWPLTRQYHTQKSCLQDVFCFSHHSVWILSTGMCENTIISKILPYPALSKPLRSHISLFRCFFMWKLTKSLSVSAWFLRLPDWIIAQKSGCFY